MAPASDAMEVTPTPAPAASPVVTLGDVSKTLSYIVRGVELNQPRLLARAIRQHAKVRHFIAPSTLKTVLLKCIPSTSPMYGIIVTGIEKLPLDSALEPEGSAPSEGAETNEAPMEISDVSTLPEVEVYLSTLLVTTLLRYSKNEDAAFCATALIERLTTFNRRSLDLLASKALFYFSLAYERIHRLENIRSILLNAYRTACLHHDELTQCILINLLLRNYIQYNLFSQAQILIAKTVFPENASNNQYCRYLYYEGRIQSVQLQYSDAYLRLTMAARKVPQDSSFAFIIEIQKLTIIVQLLMGDIPERSLFNQADLRAPLKPYLYLTQAVRNGNLPQFDSIVTKYSSTFESDANLTLIHRLGFNVLKIGLRKIYLSYSRISLADIAQKLCLPSIASAEYICAKAIRYTQRTHHSYLLYMFLCLLFYAAVMVLLKRR